MLDNVDAFFVDQIDQAIIVLKIHQQVPDWELASHQHIKSQLMMTINGLITVETPSGIWVVPAQHALWIPSNVSHKVSSYGISSGYVAFIDPQLDHFSELTCTMLQVTNLLNALLERVESLSEKVLSEKGLRLHQCLLDEIQSVVKPTFFLLIPQDLRLVKVTDNLLRNPEQNQSLAKWAKLCCMSERSLTRTFHQTTGMSINQWRRKLHVVLALQWLTEGNSVHQVAMKLGYDSDSSFIMMFKKIMHLSPRNYMQQT